MTDSFTTCDHVRDRAFEYRRGELDADERESVEEHLEDCAACRDYVEKLFTLMSSPEDVIEPSDDYADALFEQIEARVEDDRRRGADAPQDSGTGGEVFAPAERSFGWRGALALAAGFLLAVGIGWFLNASGVFEDDTTTQVERGLATSEEDESGSPEANDDASRPEYERFADLRTRPSTRPGVGVLASAGAQWSLAGDNDLVLRLERGTVLVEYIPRPERRFRVEAPGMKVRVVGTIFYVSADDDSTAGVVAGEVEVESDSGETMTVEQGQRVNTRGRIEPMPTDTLETLREQVDVRRHHAALRERINTGDDPAPSRASKEEDSSRADVARTRPEETERNPDDGELSAPLARRRASAESAIRAGDFEKAEAVYEELLEEIDPGHPAAPSIHLDLAGLYLEQMNRPERALPYLRDFLRKWPNDVAASAVQRRLCALTDDLGTYEPRCDEGDIRK